VKAESVIEEKAASQDAAAEKGLFAEVSTS